MRLIGYVSAALASLYFGGLPCFVCVLLACVWIDITSWRAAERAVNLHLKRSIAAKNAESVKLLGEIEERMAKSRKGSG